MSEPKPLTPLETAKALSFIRLRLGEVRQKRDAVKRALEDQSPGIFSDRKHLDANTPERAYWHHGYVAALTDVLRKLEAK